MATMSPGCIDINSKKVDKVAGSETLPGRNWLFRIFPLESIHKAMEMSGQSYLFSFENPLLALSIPLAVPSKKTIGQIIKK
jgi:hypothetical protein